MADPSGCSEVLIKVIGSKLAENLVKLEVVCYQTCQSPLRLMDSKSSEEAATVGATAVTAANAVAARATAAMANLVKPSTARTFAAASRATDVPQASCFETARHWSGSSRPSVHTPVLATVSL